MLLLFILAFLLLASATTASALRSLDSAPVIHFTLARRGGVFAATQYLRDYVNVTYLAQQLEATESRFNVTQRQVQGNRLVRKPKKGFRPGGLLGEVAAKDIWCAHFLQKTGRLGRCGETRLTVFAASLQVCQDQYR